MLSTKHLIFIEVAKQKSFTKASHVLLDIFQEQHN
jgi:hypothetical protein